MSVVEGWKTESLGRIAQLTMGQSPDSKYYSAEDKEGMPFLQGCAEFESKFPTPALFCSHAKKTAKRGSILFSVRAPVGKTNIADRDYIIGRGLAAISGIEVDQTYLEHYLAYVEPRFRSASQGSTFEAINSSELSDWPIEHPTSKPEQTKIAEILSTVDRAIEQTEALIAKQQRIKIGLMQDLLTRGIDEHGNLRSEQTHEFKDSPMGRIPVEWVVAPLSHICEMITDGVHYAVRKTEAGIPFLFVSCIRDGEIQFDKASFIDRSTYEVISKGCEPKPGLVLYTVVGSYGNAAEVTSDKELGFERNLACITPNRDVLYPGYLVAWLNSDSGRNTADKYALGNAQKLISLSQLGSFCIPLPLFEEQIRIANKKDEVTQAVQSHKRTLLKLHKIKTALMQDLLTGKKRVTSLLNHTEVVHG